jgi:hypothetical protein
MQQKLSIKCCCRDILPLQRHSSFKYKGVLQEKSNLAEVLQQKLLGLSETHEIERDKFLTTKRNQKVNRS